MSVWLLPENIADILPREARLIEKLRREFLELVTSHGFEQVRPPLIEYVDSLSSGTDGNLDLRTFKIIDQSSGRLLGLRADMTPQIARIDAHILNRSGITRLSYAGSLLHARPLHPMASREPYVSGVELFGSTNRNSDLEVISLGVKALHRIGIENVHLDLGHTAVVRSVLSKDSETPKYVEKILYALSHKDSALLKELAGCISDKTIEDLLKIIHTFGDESALDELDQYFADQSAIRKAIEEVRWLAQHSGAEQVSFDFADVHGYQYLTGVTFSVTIPKRFQAVMRGGRYDDIGAKFGRMRPAVGFTIYLREIASLMETRRPYAILAPGDVEDPGLKAKVDALRESGNIVVTRLPEDTIASLEEAFRLDEELVFENGIWQLKYRSETN
ncbi:MAG: ATP phosphoribosyltransferase regulatory subunit [Burkholderiaceae bacterium]|nr:ATP phosphoribosyltransferase regulatory subunit [Burkholderiaceae bacterium]